MDREEFFAEFLNDEIVKIQLKLDNLASVYNILPVGERRGQFSELLYHKDVDPFDYFSQYIPQAAFAYISSTSDMPKKVYIKDSVEYILHCAFAGNQAIKVVYLPANLKKVEWKAFHDCTNLEKIYYPGTSDKLLREVKFGHDWRSTYLKITCLDKEVLV